MFFSLVAVEVGKHLYWNIAGLTLHGQVLLVTWLVILIILTIAFLGTLKLKLIPEGLQNFSEIVFEYVASIAKEQLGEYEYRPWISLIGTLFFLFSYPTGWGH
jgi:F-type H+-transporting ATPase subunit a